MDWENAAQCSECLGERAVTALIEEVELTPKPGLVDKENNGSHSDLTINLMIRSAQSLRATFAEMAFVSFQERPSRSLREKVAEIGRQGEKVMLKATGGTNTHKGAIWAIGLLTSSVAMNQPEGSIRRITQTAGKLARYPDRYRPIENSNGSRVQKRYGTSGAKGEAEQGFPHVVNVALPALYAAREKGVPEHFARIDTLIALIARLDDTCILHRGGMETLLIVKEKAKKVLMNNGVSTQEGWKALLELDNVLLSRNASPGGSADLLAAALFLDGLEIENKHLWGERIGNTCI